jgi:hypothetical protein
MEISRTEVEVFVELAFEQMLEKARMLGDEVDEVPDVEGANSVFALVVHCVGMCDFWFDHVVLGNATTRNRESEFVAEGSVADLEELVGGFGERLPGLVEGVVDAGAPAAPALRFDRPWPWTVGAIVLHVIEELFQHAGHVDITTDLVLAARSDS